MRLNLTLTLTKECMHQYLSITKHHIVHIYFLYLQNIEKEKITNLQKNDLQNMIRVMMHKTKKHDVFEIYN